MGLVLGLVLVLVVHAWALTMYNHIAKLFFLVLEELMWALIRWCGRWRGGRIGVRDR